MLVDADENAAKAEAAAMKHTQVAAKSKVSKAISSEEIEKILMSGIKGMIDEVAARKRSVAHKCKLTLVSIDQLLQ